MESFPIQLNMKEMSRFSEVSDPLKRKMKEKKRKQLWDSLLEVYEKEADKKNALDCEEIPVEELCKWSHSTLVCSSLRAYPQVVKNNPELITSQFTEMDEDGKHINVSKSLYLSKKRKTETSSWKKSSKSVSLKKIKTCSKTPSTITLKFSQYKARKRKKKELKNTKPSKLSKPSFTNDMKISKSKFTNHPQSELFKSVHGIHIKNPNTDQKNGMKNHDCNFKYSMPSNNKNEYVHSSGRVLDCRLVFKICECFESDEIF